MALPGQKTIWIDDSVKRKHKELVEESLSNGKNNTGGLITVIMEWLYSIAH